VRKLLKRQEKLLKKLKKIFLLLLKKLKKVLLKMSKQKLALYKTIWKRLVIQ
jgi:hypothetical protein